MVPALASGTGVDPGWWSLAPAAITLILAFATRNVIVALVSGVFAGAAILAWQTGDIAALNAIDRFFLPALGTKRYAQILLVYLWCLGGLLGVWEATGAARRFGQQASRLFFGRRGSKLFTVLAGWVFHQGGTVSCVLTGATARPVTRDNGVTAAEFAYLIDATASPVASLVPFNVWPFFVGGLLAGTTWHGHTIIPDASEGIRWYLRAIPLNVYSILSVLLVGLVALEWWPFVPWKMQRRVDSSSKSAASQSGKSGAPPGEAYRVGAADFLIPLAVLVSVSFLPAILRAFGWEELPYFGERRDAINEAFVLATVTAIAVAVARGMAVRNALDAFLKGCQSMTTGAIILGLAVTLGEVSRQLDPAAFLATRLGDHLPVWLLPASLFLLACGISFTIGSSWATYAVLLPVAAPLAFGSLMSSGAVETHGVDATGIDIAEGYLVLCVSAVLGGGVFGDHCSPVSDTTILASVFGECDVMEHTLTQLPFGLVAAAAAVLFYLVAGWYVV